MRRRTLLAVACLGLLLGRAPAAAQNLLANPDFSGSLTGWNVLANGSFTVLHDPAVGYTAPGSLQILTAGTTTVSLAVADQCVPVVGGARYDALALFRPTGGLAGVLRGSVRVNWHADPTCSSFITYVASNIAGPNTDVWHGLTAANILAPATAQSALVEVRIPATIGAAAGHIDDVFFGLHGTPVELQELSIE